MNPRERILIVDDNPMNVDIISELLEDDYSLETADCGETAISRAIDFKPDLVLLDIMMPGISGYEVCRQIRKHPDLTDVKIILVSAKAMAEERLAGYKAGADDYLTKPFDHEELIAKVRVFLRLKQAEGMDEFKHRIIQLLNHEIRTPLNGIISSLDVLTSEFTSDTSDSQEFITIAQDSCNRLLGFCDRALLFSEFKAGTIALDLSERSLRTALLSQIELLREPAARNGVTFALTGESDCTCQVDSDYLPQILKGLLDYALANSPQDGRIDIELRKEQQFVVMEMSDAGPGFPAALQRTVLTGLVSPDIEHHEKGDYLDLALSAEIAMRLGGSLHPGDDGGEETTTWILRLARPGVQISQEPSPQATAFSKS